MGTRSFSFTALAICILSSLSAFSIPVEREQVAALLQHELCHRALGKKRSFDESYEQALSKALTEVIYTHLRETPTALKTPIHKIRLHSLTPNHRAHFDVVIPGLPTFRIRRSFNLLGDVQFEVDSRSSQETIQDRKATRLEIEDLETRLAEHLLLLSALHPDVEADPFPIFRELWRAIVLSEAFSRSPEAAAALLDHSSYGENQHQLYIELLTNEAFVQDRIRWSNLVRYHREALEAQEHDRFRNMLDQAQKDLERDLDESIELAILDLPRTLRLGAAYKARRLPNRDRTNPHEPERIVNWVYSILNDPLFEKDPEHYIFSARDYLSRHEGPISTEMVRFAYAIQLVDTLPGYAGESLPSIVEIMRLVQPEFDLRKRPDLPRFASRRFSFLQE